MSDRARPGLKTICLLDGGRHEPGGPRPIGYSQTYEWAEVQRRAGLPQVRCGLCCLFRFPQELSGIIGWSDLTDSKGNSLKRSWPVCLACEARTKGEGAKR